ncbi:MAG: hypothetical protein ACQEVA_05855 [Myxococcota bacterium]
MADVYECINVTQDPDLREPLMSGGLFEVQDSLGDERHELALPVRIHNEDIRLLALVIPDSLRHREFELRVELLQAMAEEGQALPAYIRDFEVVFGLDAYRRLEEAYAAQSEGYRSRDEETQLTELPDPSEREAAADVEEQWQQVGRERERLEEREAQLEEVRSRIDRERARMDEVESELADERASLEQLRADLEEERQSLEAMRLNLEEKQLKAEQGAPQSNAEESTQVVTDDQFIEVVDAGQEEESEPGEDVDESDVLEESEFDESSEAATQVTQSPLAGSSSAATEERSSETVVEALDTSELSAEFDDESAADDLDAYATLIDGRVHASCRVDDSRAEELVDQDLEFYVQYHDIDGVPVVALTLAKLDERGKPIETIGVPLDVQHRDDKTIIHRLSEQMDARVDLFTSDGLVGAFDVRAPLESNLSWILEHAEAAVEGVDREGFIAAAAKFLQPDFERVGTMRHNFFTERFDSLETPSEVKLASGIVGYWSSDDMFEYLVTNRSFPLDQFRAIQRRVVSAAVDEGIYINAPLRQLAVEMDLAADPMQLIERLITNFAEVSVRLKANDLDPYDEWENWEALINFAEEMGVTPDPEVLELAESSLERAKNFQQNEQDSAEAAGAVDQSPGVSDTFDDLVVARRSEATGVTYFLPDDAVLDTFDDLATMSREDLELLLEDPQGRLEAAQMLVERFGGDALQTVLLAAEEMNAPEVASLGRFLQTKADGLEAELVKVVEENIGPSATLVAARALAGARSQTALPALVDAYLNEDRRGNKDAMARALASYGQKLVPTISRELKKRGSSPLIITLLMELERANSGLLEELAKDRSKSVREATQAARDRIR